MTVMLPLAPAAPDTPSFAPADDARAPLERGASFGPALSDARDRLSRPDPERTSTAERQPPRPDRPDRPDRPAEPKSRETDAARDDAGPADEADEGATSADSAVDREEESTTSEAATTASGASATTADDAANQNAAMDATAVMTATIHPTAKGAGGDGDPSAVPAVEEVATPTVAEPVLELVDETSLAEVDLAAETPVARTDEVARDAARQAGLTSLEQVADANLELAQRILPATTEDVAGPVAVDPKRADPFGTTAAEGVPLDGPTAEAVRTTTPDGETANVELAVGDEVEVDGVELEATASESADRPTPKTSAGTANTAESPEPVVVLAREAGRAADTARPTATPTAAAPLDGAEANLWEDVRSAFERIRSTGDGQEVRIKLRPAELGELIVQVRTQGDHVSVRLVASSAAAQQTLIDDRLRLAAELARAGFDEGSVDIGQHNAGDSDRRGGESTDQGEGQPTPQGVANAGGLDRVGATREIFERRDPIRTDSGFRPGRNVQSTISLTL